MIKSPVNYTGNKSRILNQILPLFPTDIDRFVDMCCGGASVGINALVEHTICIDKNRQLIDVLKTLKTLSEYEIIDSIECIIAHYGLSNTYTKGYAYYKSYVEGNNGFKKYNKDGFYKLRDDYNTKKFKDYREKSLYLYALIIYGFNNDMRFNKKGEYNLPIGKTDFNKSIRDKIRSFKNGTQDRNIEFYDADFHIMKELELREKDFVYVDPPYLITNAVYNESNGWNEQYERELLSVLDFLNAKNIRFALSNVLRKSDIENDILIRWIHANGLNIHTIEYHYRSSSYNKKNRNAQEQEVVITNYAL